MNNYLYNIEYERIVLGMVLLEPNLFEVIQDLSEETFYFEYNRVIYKAMKLLDKEKSPIDLISLVNKIEQIDNTVEMMYITNLNQYATTASNIEFYIGEIKEMKQTTCIEIRGIVNLSHISFEIQCLSRSISFKAL